MSTPTPSERRQILWDLTFLCWDRPKVGRPIPRLEGAFNLNEQNLSRFMKDAAGNAPTDPAFTAMVLYLDWSGLLQARHYAEEISEKYPEPLFHSLLSFMEIGDYTLAELQVQAPGFYRAYRPASTYPGHFWAGGLHVWQCPSSGALMTEEFHQSGGFDGRPNKTVRFHGYLVRKGRQYTIIYRNQSSLSLSVALLPSVTVEDNRITNLTGATMDMSTGHLWSGMLIYDRVALPAVCVASPGDPQPHPSEDPPDSSNDEKEAFFRSARVCTADEIPQSIVYHFSGSKLPNLWMF